MSYDIKIQNKCDHRINWERSALQADRVTIPLTAPVSSVASLSLRINNVPIQAIGYTVTTERTILGTNSPSKIIMKDKVQLYVPLVEIQYITLSQTCPKCGGIGIIDDYFVSGSGDVRTTDREYLLLQNLEKCIVTQVGTNPFHTWYGSGLQSYIGKKISDRTYLNSKVKEEISTTIDKFKTTQKQLVSSGRKIDNGELFGQLLDIIIEQTDDPTIVLVTVAFTSQSGRKMEYSQYLDMSSQALALQ